jgi:class 3 adenylate cyclase/tetratricopeptide (TPR) repeat protein
MSNRSAESPPKPPGKRHRITALFTDLSASSYLGRMMEPEHYAYLINRVSEIWHQTAEKHGGTILQTQGDGALIVFGYPHSHEDDGRRAAELALDVHQQVGELKVDELPVHAGPLEMHTGIHAGIALLAEGDLELGRFSVIGDVANTAAHLSDSAVRGQILASLESLGPHANIFVLGKPPRGSADLPAHVECVEILGRGSAGTRFEATAQRGLSPLVGRTEVTKFFRDFLVDGCLEEYRCVVVVGGAGLGKTRHLQELSQQDVVTRFELMHGSCENYLGAEVLQPFVQMLRTHFGIDPKMSKSDELGSAKSASQSQRTQLGINADIVSAALSGRATAGGVVGDLLAFFAAVSDRSSLLLVIDDWQWADDASRQLLEALLQLPEGPRFILAARPKDDGADWIAGAPHLTLTPFQPQETAKAVRQWLPDVDPFLATRIHEYAGGVPLFVEELCHSASANALWEQIQSGRTQTWLATLVSTRLARLPKEQADVVSAAAVIGNVVPEWLLEIACERPPTAEKLDALAKADFLYPDQVGTLRFKHGFTRDSIYEAIGLHERIALHRRIEAGLLKRASDSDRDDMLEALAYHSRGAGQWERAAHYAERAGDKATAAFGLDLARTQYQAAMEALDRVPERTREQSLRWCILANKLGMTCIFDPLALHDDLTVFERAAELASKLNDDNVLARARYWLGYICYGFGRYREGAVHARLGLALARKTGDLPLAAQIEASLGQILAASCEYNEAMEIMGAAVEVKRQRSRPGGGLAIGSAYTLACKGSVLADRGDFEIAHACFHEALSLLGGSTHPVGNSVRNWISLAFIWEGRWEEAERVAVESSRIAENTRALLLLAVSRAMAGFVRWISGGQSEGLVQLRNAASWMESRRGRLYMSLYYGWLVQACLSEGRIDEARSYAARVLWRTRQGERLGEAVACRALAITAAKARDGPATEHWMQLAQTSALIRGSARETVLNEVAQGQILATQGQMKEARLTLTSAHTTLCSLGMYWHASASEEILEIGKLTR